MSHELNILQLEDLRNIINSALKQGDDGNEALSQFLSMHFDLTREEREQILSITAGKSKDSMAKDLTRINEKINSYIQLLELRPRNHNPEQLDYEKLKQLVNNRLAKLRREMRD